MCLRNVRSEFDKSTPRDHGNARGIVWRGGALIENRVGIRSPYTGSAFSNTFWFSKIKLIRINGHFGNEKYSKIELF